MAGLTFIENAFLAFLVLSLMIQWYFKIRFAPIVKEVETKDQFPESHFAINFERLGTLVAIEREPIKEDSPEVTTISYVASNGEIEPFYLHCDREAHVVFVTQFKQAVEAQKNDKTGHTKSLCSEEESTTGCA